MCTFITFILAFQSKNKGTNPQKKMRRTTITCIFISFSKVTINAQKAQEHAKFHVHIKTTRTLNQEKNHNRIQETNAYIFSDF
jgi:hypothetical protein